MNTARFLVMTAFNFISHIWTNPVNIIRVMRYNTIVFRRTSSNIQIKDGSTIAAYVAFTQKPFRTNEVLGVSAVSTFSSWGSAVNIWGLLTELNDTHFPITSIMSQRNSLRSGYSMLFKDY